MATKMALFLDIAIFLAIVSVCPGKSPSPKRATT